LLARLDRALAGQVTLVAAPAGYGKTTLLSQWVARQQVPVAWLTLDEEDDDVGLFLEDLVASIEVVAPDSCRRTRSLLGRLGLPPVGLLGRELANDLDGLGELVLVLDDFHILKAADTLEVVRRLVSRPPGSLHLVLSGRADPRLPLGSLRGRGLLNELRARDLRFDEEEAAAYMLAVLGKPLGESLLSKLVDRTEGWIAGLHLAALSLQGSEDIEDRIQKFAGSDRFIADYLVEELLARLDPSLRQYLAATSILDRLSASLCEAVLTEASLDRVEGRPVLEWLEESNLFVVSLDTQQEWFRYHHLFRELLRHSLEATNSAEYVETLHVRAGRWLSAAGLVDDALGHFLRARRADLACDAVELHRGRAIDEERWRALERWGRRLGPDVVQTRPALVLTDAWLAHQRQDLAEMCRHCDRAEALIDGLHRDFAEDAALGGEIAAMRAEVAYWRGDGLDALLQSRRALALLSHEALNARAVATVFEGGALHLLGRSEEAAQVFRRAPALDPVGWSHPRLMVGRAILALMTGDVDDAARAGELMLSQASSLGLEDSLGYAHFLLGFTAYLRNRLTVAEGHFRAVDPYASHLIAAKQANYGLAWVHHVQGRQAEALDVIDRWATFVQDLDLPLVPEVALLRARLTPPAERRPDDVDLARSVARTVRAMPEIPLQACFEFAPLSAVALLVQQGGGDDLAASEALLGRLLGMAEVHANTFRAIQCLILQALVFDRQQRTEESLDALQRAVALASPGRLVRLFMEMGADMQAALRSLRARGCVEPFLDELILAFGPIPPPPRSRDLATSSVLVAGHPIDCLLTNRELDVLELLAQRLTNKEIAKQLFISPATVKRHTLHIYSKLGVGGRREAVLKGRDLGFIPAAR
jgi:LuxR family maltose regulon positive regulatory protein